eukprot:c10511_g1_i1.p1 GENE.c10511_g1_i1~~c10511_g1_i1.p1  ORF type:complete len:366 (+),score=61.52 c10511_g1_i1:84-1100(+)
MDAAEIRAMDELVSGVQSRDRRSLSRAITLVESSHPKHYHAANYLLKRIVENTPNKPQYRIALSGSPGAGKSSLIEAFGNYLTDQGLLVAVLAIDPCSTISGGSILGDKTRMPKLSTNPSAYIRPAPTRGILGGIARGTSESMVLCQGAGYDVVIIETVGVGQSEVAARDIADMFVVLLPPGAGDDLQGIKRGIIEVADLLVVTKNDGSLANAAQQAGTDYGAALRLQRARYETWRPQVVLCSAKEGTGLREMWDAIKNFYTALTPTGEMNAMRLNQKRTMMQMNLDAEIQFRLRHDPITAKALQDADAALAAGAPPRDVARSVFRTFVREPATTHEN